MNFLFLSFILYSE